jgi:hypothetical protein
MIRSVVMSLPESAGECRIHEQANRFMMLGQLDRRLILLEVTLKIVP